LGLKLHLGRLKKFLLNLEPLGLVEVWLNSFNLTGGLRLGRVGAKVLITWRDYSYFKGRFLNSSYWIRKPKNWGF